jgi:hypothetical protein
MNGRAGHDSVSLQCCFITITNKSACRAQLSLAPQCWRGEGGSEGLLWEKHALQLRGDALWVAKSESASAFLYWNGRDYAWYQESD